MMNSNSKLSRRSLFSPLYDAIAALIGTSRKVLLGEQEQIPETIRARRIEVVNQDGEVTVLLQTEQKSQGGHISILRDGGVKSRNARNVT